MKKRQTAQLTLKYEDDTSQTILISNVIELGVTPQARQSIEFREVSDGSWVMAFTKPVFQGKKISTINLTKNE